jgi:hypothetical protein
MTAQQTPGEDEMTHQDRTTHNNLIEQVHLVLVEDDSYLALLDAVYNSQAVEGSLADDDIMAAKMIRDKAYKLGNAEVARQKLASIVKALRVVLRRYGASRKQRRESFPAA